MANLTPSAHRHFAAHHGVASIAQLEDCGVNRHVIRKLEAIGSLELVLQGAYRTPSVELDELGRCAAVCVAHPQAVISGPTAGRLWNFRKLPRDKRVHVIVPPHSQPTRSKWVVPYRTSAIHRRDIVERAHGIRLTTRERTAYDLARLVSSVDLTSIIEQAMHDGQLTNDEMVAVATDWLSPRRSWARRFVEILERRGSGRPAESHYEFVLGETLLNVGVKGLERQHHIELPGYGAARFDLAVPSLKWAIEVDVFPTHRESAGIAADSRRDAAANMIGWLVSRVSESQFGAALPATVEMLRAIYLDRLRRKRFRSGER